MVALCSRLAGRRTAFHPRITFSAKTVDSTAKKEKSFVSSSICDTAFHSCPFLSFNIFPSRRISSIIVPFRAFVFPFIVKFYLFFSASKEGIFMEDSRSSGSQLDRCLKKNVKSKKFIIEKLSVNAQAKV